MIAAMIMLAVGMALGLPAIDSNQQQNLIANKHLARAVGDLKVNTATNVRSHRFVIDDTTDGEVQVAGDAAINVLGIVTHGVLDASDPSTWGNGEVKTTEDFAADDIVHVEAGKGTIRKVLLLDGESVAPGDRLVTAAGGKVRKYLDAAQSTPDDPAAIVATAQETSAPSGDDAFIAAEVVI